MDFIAKHWGDLASVAGVALTVWIAWLAKTAAEQARDAAEEVRDQISRFDTVAELSAAITIIEEIMRLQRTQAWEIVWDIVLERHSICGGILCGVSRVSRVKLCEPPSGLQSGTFVSWFGRSSALERSRSRVNWIQRHLINAYPIRLKCLKRSEST
jgi:hypothetical protein